MSTIDPPTGPIQLPVRRRGQAGWVVACVAVAALLVVLAFWARSGAAARSADADGTSQAAARADARAKQLSGDGNTGNDALSDAGRTREVTGYLTTAIEATFSYDYTDLDKTERAVDEHMTSAARCVYDDLFEQVRQYAPAQHIVLRTTVREVALATLTRADAKALVYIDQLSTRTDVNKTVAVGGQFEVNAHHDGKRWWISGFDMFGQPLFNGQPAPSC